MCEKAGTTLFFNKLKFEFKIPINHEPTTHVVTMVELILELSLEKVTESTY